MAKLKAKDIRDLSQDEMEQRLTETREELFNLRFQNATGQLDNYKRLKELRRDVARIKTILRQKEIAEAEGGTE
jgi:large subunit ribosomal protein L29